MLNGESLVVPPLLGRQVLRRSGWVCCSQWSVFWRVVDLIWSEEQIWCDSVCSLVQGGQPVAQLAGSLEGQLCVFCRI